MSLKASGRSHPINVAMRKQCVLEHDEITDSRPTKLSVQRVSIVLRWKGSIVFVRNHKLSGICKSILCVRKSRVGAADKGKLHYQMWLLAASAIRRAKSLVDGVSSKHYDVLSQTHACLDVAKESSQKIHYRSQERSEDKSSCLASKANVRVGQPRDAGTLT